MKKKIKCLFTAVEADPLVKVGGLADVAFALPQALKTLPAHEAGNTEIDIRLMLPCHDTACNEVMRAQRRFEFNVHTPAGIIPTIAFETEINQLPIYLISSPLIPEKTTVYSADAYQDGVKFLFFSKAVLELAKVLNWKPDIVHANDWHTAITNFYVKQNPERDHFFQDTKRVITVHNLPFMGAGTEKAFQEMGIAYSRDKKLPAWARKIPLPMGLSASDKIVTVSPTYANEIQTSEFGCGLEEYLQSRKSDLRGIINGIDTHKWDPAADQAIYANYSIDQLDKRINNKHELQLELGLNPDPDTPLVAYIGRMDQQKGVDVLIEALKNCKHHTWQTIILGTGNSILEENSMELQALFPDNVRAVLKFDGQLARKIYAGADILLMPSRYEPCGIAQMIAMRYGCIPIAHATGGLKDTIRNIVENKNGTGYLFHDLTPQTLIDLLAKAFQDYRDKSKWRTYQTNGMKIDFSWNASALKYEELYLALLRSN